MNWEDFLKLPLVLIAPQAALLAMWVVWRWGLLPLGRWIELDPGGLDRDRDLISGIF